MRLTRLDLQGFKSFADSTEMIFEPGVTAIVGPNGCGKSNVSDAVRWVLGEQRARLLRGSKMDEVIFQGSSARRAVNLAEVSLHFENDDGQLGIPFQEVVITRRLSRSGESEYFLNRAPCRLRDIADMLRGTGLGSDTGVVIEAKMIDALLSDRPDDRRELFEEAAGVGLYRDRRRTTERRLEETTVDLQRLDDLISEVQSQVRSLARQRKRAERHAEIMARRFTVEIGLARREMQAWSDELERLDGRVAELRRSVPTIERRAAAAEQERDTAHATRAATETQRAELSRAVAVQRDRVQQIRSEMAVAEERQRNALAQRQRAEVEASERTAYGTRVAADRDQAADERQRNRQQLEIAHHDLAARTEAEEHARTQVAEARASLDAAQAQLREIHDRARRAELDRERSRRELDELIQRLDQLERERSQLFDAARATEEELESATLAATETAEHVDGAAAALERARSADAEAHEREVAGRAELVRADDAYAAIEGRVHALEELERERIGLAPSSARLLRDRDRFGEGAILGPLSDFLSADQDAAMLVERFLGATVHAVIVRDQEVAESVRKWHAEVNPGPLLLLPLDSHPLGSAAESGEQSLSARIDAAPAARAWTRALLGGARTVEDGAAFIDARGAMWLPGATAGPGPLRRRAELYTLRSELTSAEEKRRTAAAAVDALRAARAGSEQQVRLASEALDRAHAAARRAGEHRTEVERRRARAQRDIGDADELRDRLAVRADEMRALIESLDAAIAEAAESMVRQEGGLLDARTRVSACELAQEEARELRTRAQVEEAQLQARVHVAEDRERRLQQEAESAATRLASLHAELADLSDADRALAALLGEWQLDLQSGQAALLDVEDRLAAAESAVRQVDDALAAAEHALDAARREAHSLGDELHHAELRLAELGGRRTAVRERLEAEWRRPIEEMLASAVDLEVDEAGLRDEADTLRQQLEALGPVNVLAIEEHDETVKRCDFLTTQRADLAEARQSLAQAIREIDATARELFFATFTQVRENFRQIFMTLFGGGECDLRLENPEAPMDCDIEIHASPRGKRTQRIHLLSSGERALVALSLLFGIFLTKPSPFCLLDEVDAPLDDANVGRFVRMLNEFKTKTQFIVITHNPRTTTEAADSVYGVTMQEPGVSSLVSVRVRGGVSVDGAA
ncbi:MAG TPA: chromosome segregation protein SMC [Gemmatimonadaceae bacterium]|nr:chromosome segregation protein SMC [Gemmatimonadaceae bacterium]